MRVDEQRILDLSQDVWNSALGLELRPSPPDTATEERRLASCINVSGAWEGTIRVECPESIGRHAAAMLHAADGQSAAQEEIQEALNDLAEMIGKQIHPLLPESSRLSSPKIGSDNGESTAQTGTEVEMSCEGRPVRIGLFERDQGPD